MEKMELYKMWRSVPSEALSKFNNGTFSGDSINPMWRIQMLTEAFGPVGFGWYYTIDRQWTETVGNIIKAFVNVSLYVKYNNEWSKPIQGTGGNFMTQMGKGGLRVSDECYKMALTDAISIACKSLGIGADVWFADGRDKYSMTEEDGELVAIEQKPEIEVAREEIANASDNKQLMAIYNSHQNLHTNQEFMTLLGDRKREIAA